MNKKFYGLHQVLLSTAIVSGFWPKLYGFV